MWKRLFHFSVCLSLVVVPAVGCDEPGTGPVDQNPAADVRDSGLNKSPVIPPASGRPQPDPADAASPTSIRPGDVVPDPAIDAPGGRRTDQPGQAAPREGGETGSAPSPGRAVTSDNVSGTGHTPGANK